MKIAIIGFGLQGRSAYEYWRQGNDITVCDGNKDIELPNDVTARLGTDHLKGLEDFDLIVRSPKVYPGDIVNANGPSIVEKITSNTNEFMRVCPAKNIIGVTGTKGKGTTSTLVAKLLVASGKRVHLGGNIGTPPLDLLKDDIKPDDWVVLELANFQLIDLRYSPRIAICLMVTPEHLDWHTDLNEYISAKQQLFLWQTAEDTAIFYADNSYSKEVVSVSKGLHVPYMQPPGAYIKDNWVVIDDQSICEVKDLPILGKHNWQNICAAVTTVWQIIKNADAMRPVLTSFSGLPFRLELRREVGDVRYYNDSFASAPPAAVAALEAIPGKKVVIFGGFDRGLDLSEMVQSLQANSSHITGALLIGASAKRLSEALSKAEFTNYQVSQAKDMETIVREASKLARPGDAVVLSPGFPSFDMFNNFEDRGQQFNEAVAKL